MKIKTKWKHILLKQQVTYPFPTLQLTGTEEMPDGTVIRVPDDYARTPQDRAHFKLQCALDQRLPVQTRLNRRTKGHAYNTAALHPCSSVAL